MKICVFGASSDTLAEEYYDAARRLGELMAKGGHTLVYGGGSDGLMRACADGVKTGGGAAIGVAPRMFDEGDFLRRDFGELIFTETMAARKELMRSIAEAFIVLPGGTGTMDEFFETLTLKQLGMQGKAIVLLNTLGSSDPLRDARGSAEAGPGPGSHRRAQPRGLQQITPTRNAFAPFRVFFCVPPPRRY